MTPNDQTAFNDRVTGIRDAEFPILKDQIYLDHAGTTLYAKSLVDRFATEMTSNLFGNPHSASASSQTSMSRIEDVRLRVLQFFHADPSEFDLVFVANTTAGIKLVTEAFRACVGGFNYMYHQACHTSLVGVREEAADSLSVDSEVVETWLQDRQGDLQAFVSSGRTNLFAYPAQSNMNGQRFPLDWVRRIRSKGASPETGFHTLLDAASYVATSPLSLQDSDMAPDFTVLSFYKMFGFPDLGAVIIRREAAPIFQARKYFGGGTVDMVTSGREQWHERKSQSLHDSLEDGTLPVHSIVALGIAIGVFEELFGSMEHVSTHTSILAQRMSNQLASMQHGNGQSVCSIYSPEAQTSTPEYGSIIAFNVRNEHGAWASPAEFEKLAAVKGFHIRTGGLCNPGGIATVLNLQPWEMRRNFSIGFRCGNEDDIIGGKPTGLIRVSFGAMSTIADVDKFCSFVQEFYCTPTSTELHESITHSATRNDAPDLNVAGIIVYPIKSCGGYHIPAGVPWDVRPEGLAWDREWCLVHQGSSQALSQKRYPRMALFRPVIDFSRGKLEVSYSGQVPAGFPASISIPLASSPALFEPLTPSKKMASRVCGDVITTRTYSSDAINDFFSAILEVPCALARFPAGGSGDGMRQAKAHLQRHQHVSGMDIGRGMPGSFPGVDTPPDSDGENERRRILLSNESPILAISLSSLSSLNREITRSGGQPVSADVFRANVVIGSRGDGEKCTPYSEDFWSRLRIGRQEFQMLGSCRRCQMVCIDQTTAEKREEPFVTLTRTRRFDGKVFFGVHMCQRMKPLGLAIQIGDTVIVDPPE